MLKHCARIIKNKNSHMISWLPLGNKNQITTEHLINREGIHIFLWNWKQRDVVFFRWVVGE